jgi:hypothetical protein
MESMATWASGAEGSALKNFLRARDQHPTRVRPLGVVTGNVTFRL